MSTSPKSSVYSISHLVGNTDDLFSGEISCHALAESALGLPDESRPIDLGAGFACVNSRSDRHAKFVLGPGVSRLDGVIVAPDGISWSTLSTVEYSLDYDTLLGIDPIMDAYAFGHVYLDRIDSNTSSVTFELVMGTDDIDAVPILSSRAFDVDKALEMLKRNIIPNLASLNRLLMYSFVVDIDQYAQGDPIATSLKVNFVDRRNPRGFRGYAEETMATELIPTIHQFRGILEGNIELSQAAIKDLVKSWIEMNCWLPDFASYWRANSDLMSARLKKYLLDEFNIIIN